jgi:hypothetical protein
MDAIMAATSLYGIEIEDNKVFDFMIGAGGQTYPSLTSAKDSVLFAATDLF